MLNRILNLPLSISAFTLTLLGATFSAQAATVIGGPTSGQFKVSDLPNGNYRFCSDRPTSEASEEPGQPTGACFRFNKQSDRVIGTYYYPNTGESICFRGRVNSNTLSGQAIERLQGDIATSVEFSRGALTNWQEKGFLKVGQGIYVDDLNRRDAIRYRSALLNLNNFYQYNAGAISPPSNCPTRPSSTLSVSPTPDSLEELGTSLFYNKPVSLVTSSIQPVEGDADVYAYTTIIGFPARLSESEYQVNCRNAETVLLLRSRYYDSDGDLQELELVDRLVAANQENAATTQRYNANRYVCREQAQLSGDTDTNAADTDVIAAPEEVSYKRYRNEKFDYSVLYPDAILMPQGESPDQGGQVFESEDGEIVLRVYGVAQAEGETLVERYEQARADRSVTYQTREDNDFFVVSGNDDGSVFYQKTLLENGVFKVLELQYSQALRREFDAAARAIADSFAPIESGAGLAQLPADVQTAVLEAASANTEAASAIFQIVDVEQEVWPGGCLGLPQPDEACTRELVQGWRVRLEAEVAGGIRQFTYRTDDTGSRVRFEPQQQ